MSLSVATIVVANSADEYLSETLSQLSRQSHPIQQVMVVDTASSDETAQLVSRFGFSLIQPGNLRLSAAIEVAVAALAHEPDWIWILHDDSAPEPDALFHLARMAETSPSVAIIGPKLLRWDLPIEIQQMGLTLTQSGRPFLLVESEYDQGQFDITTDTLAVSTAGMLVSLSVWKQIGGIDDSAPVLAQDIEFCVKARAAGYRVVVESKARVVHAGLSMAGKRHRKWLRGSYRQALAKAHIHLSTIFLPAPVLPLIYLLMPIYSLVSIPYHLLEKKPARILGQQLGWLWAWISFPARLAARRRVRTFGSLSGMRALFASNAMVRQRRKKNFEYPPETQQDRKGFFSSGTFYIALLLPLIAIGQFPSGALTSSIPLGRSFESIWDATGVRYAQYLEGFELQSNPFNWFLSLLSVAASSPSLAASWFIFLSVSLAFLSAWLLFGLFTSSAWLRNLFALLYAVSPSLLDLQLRAGLQELVVATAAPLALYLLLQSRSAFNSARSWRWSAIAGLLSALIAVSSPVVFLLLVGLALVLGLTRPKRLLILLASAIPGLVLLYPWMGENISRPEILFTTSLTRIAPADFWLFPLFALAIALVLAAIAGRPLVAVLAAVFMASLIAIERFLGLSMAEIDAIIGLSVSLLLLVCFEALRARALRVVSSSAALAAGLASLFFFGLVPDRPSQGSDLSAPALVVAQADVDPLTRTLLVTFDDGISADLIWGDGRSADERSVMYEALRLESVLTAPIANLTAQLVAGNQDGVEELLGAIGADFVLIEGSSSQALATKASVSAMPYFQMSGESAYGTLFRVNTETEAMTVTPKTDRDLVLGTLIAFVLLAIPTPATIRGYRRRS